MVVWAGGVVTPFFLGLYKLFDRFLPPGRGGSAIGSRVLGAFVASIPANFFFFCYGTFVHHTTEWASLLAEWNHQIPEATAIELLQEVPFDFQMYVSTTRLKLENEFLNTIIASASMWIPLNTINFSLVPPHLRPLFIMTFSAVWNCYLSLAQHREATL
jgi:hypothetical protein